MKVPNLNVVVQRKKNRKRKRKNPKNRVVLVYHHQGMIYGEPLFIYFYSFIIKKIFTIVTV